MRRLLDYEWLLLLALLPLVLIITPTSGAWVWLIPLVIGLLWVVRKVVTGRSLPPTPLNLVTCLLLLMLLVSLLVTPDRAFSLPKVIGLLYGIALFYGAVATTGRYPRALWLMVALLLGFGVGVVLLALVASRGGSSLPLVGPFAPLPGLVNANEVAGVLLWIVPVAIALGGAALRLIRSRPFPTTLLSITLWGVAALTGLALLLTQSRAAYLGLAAGLLLLVLVALSRFRRLVLAGLVLFTLAASVLWLNRPDTLESLLFSPAAPAGAGNTLSLLTLQSRQVVWRTGLLAAADFPLTGMGMNTFRRLAEQVYPLWITGLPGEDIAHAHNHLLQTALDLGIPGLVAYLALWLGAAYMLWQNWQQAPSLVFKGLAAGCAAALLAYFIYGLFDAVALGARPGFIFWLLLGLVAAQHQSLSSAQTDEILLVDKLAGE